VCSPLFYEVSIKKKKSTERSHLFHFYLLFSINSLFFIMVDYKLLQDNYHLVQEAVEKYIAKYILEPTNLEYSEAKKLAIKLGVSTAVAYALFKIFIYRLYLNPVNRIPGPKVGWVPAMGNFPEIIKEESGVPQKKWANIYGGIYTFHGPWNVPRVVVTDSVLLKQVLTSNEYDFIKTPEASAFLRRILGDGLLTAEGEKHRHQRKMLNPAFSVNSIRSILPLMAKPGHRLRNEWLNIIKGSGSKVKAENGEEFTEIQISSGLSLATLDVIGWAFGQDFKSLEHAGTPYQSKLSRAYLHIFSNDVTFMRVLTFLFPIFRHLPTERNLKMKRDLRWLEEESRNLVQAGIDRAAEAKAKGIIDNKPKDLLATMIDLTDEETGKGFTLEEIRNQCLTFLAAG
jgi:cytochrome P450